MSFVEAAPFLEPPVDVKVDSYFSSQPPEAVPFAEDDEYDDSVLSDYDVGNPESITESQVLELARTAFVTLPPISQTRRFGISEDERFNDLSPDYRIDARGLSLCESCSLANVDEVLTGHKERPARHADLASVGQVQERPLCWFCGIICNVSYNSIPDTVREAFNPRETRVEFYNPRNWERELLLKQCCPDQGHSCSPPYLHYAVNEQVLGSFFVSQPPSLISVDDCPRHRPASAIDKLREHVWSCRIGPCEELAPDLRHPTL